MNKELVKKTGIIKDNLAFLRKNYNVKNIGVFGSLANGRQTKKSDIDVIVEFFNPIGFFRFLELENFLSAILKRKVDLITPKALKPTIKKDVLKEITYV